MPNTQYDGIWVKMSNDDEVIEVRLSCLILSKVPKDASCTIAAGRPEAEYIVCRSVAKCQDLLASNPSQSKSLEVQCTSSFSNQVEPFIFALAL